MNRTRNTAIIFVLGMFSFLSGLAGSSTNLAIPKIAISLGISSGLATWVVQAGLITTTILLVLFGHLGDLLSKNGIFLAGGIAFTVGSAITGFAPDFPMIITGRVVQAVGSAMIMANAMGIVSDYFPDSKRAEALSYIAMFISAGSISGPAAGGFIMSVASWRWIYWINVPLMLLVLIFGMKVLPVPKESIKTILQSLKGANWLGQGLFTIGVVVFFLSGAFFQKPGELLTGISLFIIGAGIILGSFYQDDGAQFPWIAPAVLHNRPYMISITALLLVMLVNAVSNILLPFYFQSYGLLSPFQSGLLIMLQDVVMLILAPVAGKLADRVNRELLTSIGLTILTFSQIGYILYPVQMDLGPIILPIVLNGVGMAFFLSPNNALTMSLVDKQLSGIAGSFNSLARTIGMTMGISFGSAILFGLMPGVSHISPSVKAVFLPAFRLVFVVAMVISIGATLMVLIRYVKGQKTSKKGSH